MKQLPTLVATGLTAAALVLTLSGCRADENAGSPASQVPASSATSAPASANGAAVVAPSAAAAVTAAAGQSSAQSSALAQVSADLNGINAGISQAGTDLGAGDSERTKSDAP